MNILAFAGVAALLTLAPGPDSLLVLRTALGHGRAAALVAGLGVCTACMSWGCAAGLGLTALLAGSAGLYDTVRWVGAGYLVYLGLRSLVDSRRSAVAVDSPEPGPLRSWYLRGLLTNALNPKIGVFYMSLLPQFIPAHGWVLGYSLGLTSIHVLEGFGWFAAIIVLADRLGRVLRIPSVRRGLDRLACLAFLGFAARLVFRS